MTNEALIIQRSVSGDITRRSKSSTKQVTPAEFLEVVDYLLALPGVLAIGWKQYTPYFNDGDPCEFSVDNVSFKLDPEVFGEVHDSYGLPEGENWVSEYGLYTYGKTYSDKTYALNGVDTRYLEVAMRKWTPSEFEDVALENFGDHATVIATKEGFEVEFFEHD